MSSNIGDLLLDEANRLEKLLRKFLNCHYTEFGVKANDALLKYDWKSPINFALGALYIKKLNLKSEIDSFIGNTLFDRNNIMDTYKKEGFEAVKEVIDEFENLLKKDI